MRHTLTTALTISLMAALLAGTASAQSFDTPEEAFQIKLDALMERCPELTREEAEATFNRDGTRYGEALSYAQSYCVSAEEGSRRMALQEEWSVGPKAEEINALVKRIADAEPTHTSVWIQHEPDYRFAIGFTENATETLAKYTSDPIFVGVDQPKADAAFEEEASRDFMMTLEDLGVDYGLAHAEPMTGTFRVELLSSTTEAIDALVRAGKLIVPSWVNLVPRPPLPHAKPARAVDPERLAAFPQLRRRTDGLPQTLVGVSNRHATLVMRDGCLAFDLEPGWRETENTVLTALWQKTHVPDLSDPESISVLDRLSGNRITVGDRVVLSGLQPGTEEMYSSIHSNADLLEATATGTQACPGPYRYVEGFTEAGQYDAERRANLVNRWIEHGGLDRTEAEAHVAESEALGERFEALRETLMRDHADVVADFTYFSELQPMPYGRPQLKMADLLIKQGAAAGDVLPVDLERHVRISRVPLARSELDALETRYRTLLGDSAEVYATPYDGSVSIMAHDLRPLADAMKRGEIVESETVRIGFKRAMRNIPQSADSGKGWRKTEKAVKAWDGYGDVSTLVRPFLEKIWTQRLPSTEVDRVTRELITHGYDDPAEIKAMEARGLGPLTAFANPRSGMDVALMNAVRARNIVTAELVAIDTRAPGRDGLRSTLTFRVVDSVFGDLASGETLEVRYAGGVTDDVRHVAGFNEAPLLDGLPGALQTGTTYLLKPSQARYRYDTLQATGADYDPGTDNAYALDELPIIVEGDTIKQDYGITSVSGLKTLLETAGN